MGTITIVNNSTLTNAAAVFRVALLMAENEYEALRDQQGTKIIGIRKIQNRYTVFDVDENLAEY